MIATKVSDYVITESGFGADCGAEKFLNIKCRYSGLIPDCVVIVATIRALKMHSGRFNVVPGKPLDPKLTSEDLDSLEKGCCNLAKHIENMKLQGLSVVVAINLFSHDTDKEIELVRHLAKEYGAIDAIPCNNWLEGGAGAIELAKKVVEACQEKPNFNFLYSLSASIKEKNFFLFK